MKAKAIRLSLSGVVLTLNLVEAKYLCYLLGNTNTQIKEDLLRKSYDGRKFLTENPDFTCNKSYRIFEGLATIIAHEKDEYNG